MTGSVEVLDLDKPPVNPPAGCVNTALWRLARARFDEHRKNQVGECVTCPGWKQCSGLGLAKDGLATAMGREVKNSAFWLAYIEVCAVQEARR